MKLVVCVDDKYGMAFNKRRQSKDRFMVENLRELIGEETLWMSDYSATQFENANNVMVDENCLQSAGNDYCFVENLDIAPYADKICSVILYRWNRTYPSDMKFPVDLFEARWKLESTVEFAGYSHERITREVYVL